MSVAYLLHTISRLKELPEELQADLSEKSTLTGIFKGGEQVRRNFYGSLFRGATLLRHAIEWENPKVGKGSKSDGMRGLQWRLVIAYSGYEQIEKALAPKGKQTKTRLSHEDPYVGFVLLNPLPGPVLSTKALDQMEQREAAADELCVFLGINPGKRKEFCDWLLGRVVEVDCKVKRNLFVIAQLRHLVAHGALSPTVADKLGLEICFREAPQVLLEITTRLFNHSFNSSIPAISTKSDPAKRLQIHHE